MKTTMIIMVMLIMMTMMMMIDYNDNDDDVDDDDDDDEGLRTGSSLDTYSSADRPPLGRYCKLAAHTLHMLSAKRAHQ